MVGLAQRLHEHQYEAAFFEMDVVREMCMGAPNTFRPKVLKFGVGKWVDAIDVLGMRHRDGKLWSEAVLRDVAGNMVSTPAMLSAVMVALAVAPWIDIEKEHAVEDQDELDATFMRELEDALMYQEAEQEGTVAALCLPSAEPLQPVRPPPAKFRRGMLSRVLSAAPPAPVQQK